MTSLFDVYDGPDPNERSKKAGKALIQARYEANKRLGDFLSNSQDPVEWKLRFANKAAQEVVEDVVKKYLGSISDPYAKLEKSLFQDWKKSQKKKSNYFEPGGVVQCPACGGNTYSTAARCTHCNAALKRHSTPKSAAFGL